MIYDFFLTEILQGIDYLFQFNDQPEVRASTNESQKNKKQETRNKTV